MMIIIIVGWFLAQQNWAQNITEATLTKMLQQRNIINESALPSPNKYLLTQPILTKGIGTYYHRSPRIEVLSLSKNAKANTYHRVIRMLVDSAQGHPFVVLLASINMNFKALPKMLIHEVQTTSIPFGQLLINHQIKVSTKDRSYFAISCDKTLQNLTNCPLNRQIYGRTNTLVNAKTHQWLARVIEILPGNENN